MKLNLATTSTRLRTRSRRGRPPLGAEAATVFHVRLQPSLRDALQRAADAQKTSPSDIVRRALWEFLGHQSGDSRGRSREASPTAEERSPAQDLSISRASEVSGKRVIVQQKAPFDESEAKE